MGDYCIIYNCVGFRSIIMATCECHWNVCGVNSPVDIKDIVFFFWYDEKLWAGILNLMFNGVSDQGC